MIENGKVAEKIQHQNYEIVFRKRKGDLPLLKTFDCGFNNEEFDALFAQLSKGGITHRLEIYYKLDLQTLTMVPYISNGYLKKVGKDVDFIKDEYTHMKSLIERYIIHQLINSGLLTMDGENTGFLLMEREEISSVFINLHPNINHTVKFFHVDTAYYTFVTGRSSKLQPYIFGIKLLTILIPLKTTWLILSPPVVLKHFTIQWKKVVRNLLFL
jgi:hypothetical protein